MKTQPRGGARPRHTQGRTRGEPQQQLHGAGPRQQPRPQLHVRAARATRDQRKEVERPRDMRRARFVTRLLPPVSTSLPKVHARTARCDAAARPPKRTHLQGTPRRCSERPSAAHPRAMRRARRARGPGHACLPPASQGARRRPLRRGRLPPAFPVPPAAAEAALCHRSERPCGGQRRRRPCARAGPRLLSMAGTGSFHGLPRPSALSPSADGPRERRAAAMWRARHSRAHKRQALIREPAAFVIRIWESIGSVASCVAARPLSPARTAVTHTAGGVAPQARARAPQLGPRS